MLGVNESLKAENRQLRRQVKELQEEAAINQSRINCRPLCVRCCCILWGIAIGVIIGLAAGIAYMAHTHHC